MKTETKSALLMGFGALGVLAGSITVVFWPGMFMSVLKGMLVLTNTSTSFGIWSNIPIPMYLELYLWNITNVDELRANKSARVRVEQVGPYVYREHHQKVNVVFNNNDTVTYRQNRTWHFMPEMSNGSLSDPVTSINPIVATVANTLRYQPRVVRFGADAFMRMFHEHMFLTANASAWLFDGIDDPIIDIANRFPQFPLTIPYDKFGFFYSRNGSAAFDGVFVMNTGAREFSELGNIEMWNHSNRTAYPGECGQVQGSAGELWAPEFGQPELTIFVSELCTWLKISKESEVTVLGINGVKYSGNASLFDNGWNYPHTACFCNEARDRDCLPPGALNVSLCRYGAPAFISLPHMYNSDPHYPAKIEGQHPSPDHNFELSLEMFTGMPLVVKAQLQINFLVRHVPDMELNNQLGDPDVLVPMLWFRQEVVMTDSYVRLARLALTMRNGVPIVLYVLTAIGCVLLIIGITILVRKLLYSPDTVPILSETSQQENQ